LAISLTYITPFVASLHHPPRLPPHLTAALTLYGVLRRYFLLLNFLLVIIGDAMVKTKYSTMGEARLFEEMGAMVEYCTQRALWQWPQPQRFLRALHRGATQPSPGSPLGWVHPSLSLMVGAPSPASHGGCTLPCPSWWVHPPLPLMVGAPSPASHGGCTLPCLFLHAPSAAHSAVSERHGESGAHLTAARTRTQRDPHHPLCSTVSACAASMHIVVGDFPHRPPKASPSAR
jgi:hypothetical protein